jgi:glycosyltransferase involved in cell wall biosynthesis
MDLASMSAISDQTAVIIPCFNESQAIASVVTGAKRHVSLVIVVDDGSTDDTAGVAEKAGATILRHNKNAGKGASLADGFRRALQLGNTWAVCLDGDGQHDPDEIPKFLAAAQNTGARMVIGNRMTSDQGSSAEQRNRTKPMPWLRRAVNRYMSRRLSSLAGQSLLDSQCGFRLLDLKAWSAIATSTTRFEIESELTLAFARAGHRIEFVPIRVIYKQEQSKIQPVRDTIRWFKWVRRQSP